MAILTPFQSAKLASDIYLTQLDQDSVDLFYLRNRSILSGGPQSIMKAEVGSRLINTRDTFGVCARGTGEFENDVFLIFRGSTTANSCADWISNARIGLEIGISGKPVHIGFNHIFKSMIEQIEAFFRSLGGVKPSTIHCVGHSLGGAVATLTADWVDHTKKGLTTKLYTFGAPRPATHMFSKSLTGRLNKQNIYRVYHESDPVPMIPVFPFCHAPFANMGYLIHTQPMVWPWDHKMGAYIKSVNAKGKSWSTLSPTGVHEPTEAQLKAWLESNIRVEPSATSTWQWINSALFYVLRKIMGFSISRLQAAFVGGLTLADNIAILLKKGLDGGGPKGPPPGASPVYSVSYWTERLIRKIMQIVGWNEVVETAQLTTVFMQRALQRLIEKSNLLATRAVQGMSA